MMASETSSSSCEENENSETSAKDITRLLLDLSESARYPAPVLIGEPYLCPWVKEEEETSPAVPPSRKKRVRRKKPSSPTGGGFFFSNDSVRDEECSLSYPTCYMNSYISHKTRSVHEKSGKMPPLRPEYRLSSRDQDRRPQDTKLTQQLGEKSILSTQSPCLLNKSCLAWSGSTEPLPQLKGKKLGPENQDSGSQRVNPEVVLLFKPSRDFYSDQMLAANKNTEATPRDCEPTNRNTESAPTEYEAVNRNTHVLPRDYETVYGKLLPCVRNCRVTWQSTDKLPPGRAPVHKTSPVPARDTQGSPLTLWHQHRSEVQTRSSSASSHTSTVIGSDFKGKLQNTLHRSSDSCFKKLPCGLVYGKSLRGVRLRRTTSRNSSVDLCVKPV